MRPFNRQQIARVRRSRTALLEEVLGAIDEAPIRERQIPHGELFVFGDCDAADGSITLNVPLLRTLVALHELTHRVRPEWSERTVRARTEQLLQMLDDDDVAMMNDALVRATRRSPCGGRD